MHAEKPGDRSTTTDPVVPSRETLTRRAYAALRDNRSALWRTSPLRRVRLSHALLALVLLGLAWRTIRYALGFPIWGDEAFVAVNFVERDFAGMIRPLIYGQIVPLLFMWATLAVTKVLGLSEWALRLPPFIAGFVAVPLFWRFATRVLKPRAAFLAVGMLAAAYYTVRHANEVKPYSLDLLVALGLTMLAWSVYQRPQGLGRWLALTALAGVGVWCSYPAVFVAGSAALLLAWRVWCAEHGGAPSLHGNRLEPARPTDFRHPSQPGPLVNRQSSICNRRSASPSALRPQLALRWLVFCGVLTASFAWMCLAYARPHAQAAAQLAETQLWAQTFPPIVQFWKLPVWFVLIHTGQLFAYPIGGAAPASVVTFLLVVAGSVQLWKTGRRDLLLLLLGPLALTFVAAALHLYPYGGSARIAQYLAPAFCLLAGLGAFATMRHFQAGPRLAVALRLIGVFFAVIIVVGIVRDVIHPYKSVREKGSHEAVLAVARQTRPGDRWIIFNAREEVPYAPFIGELRGTGSQFAFNVLRFGPRQVDWAPPPASVRPQAGQRVWLLAYRGSKVDFPEDQLAAYVAGLRQNLGAPTYHDDIFIYRRRVEDGTRLESLIVYRFSS